MSSPRPGRLLDTRSGGLVIAGAVVLFLVIAARWIIPAWHARGSHAFGDGKHIETYGFDLAALRIPRESVVAAGIVRDGIPALTLPPLYSAKAADEATVGEHAHFLVADDLVIGVERNGAARCYPLRVMNWHEVVNDTLGGEPIAVTFSAPSYGIAAFSRRADGETLEFGVSGLLYNANLLMYDRRTPRGTESLWSQLLARAVSGPEAGRSLTLLPVALAHWVDWRAAHPATTVLAGEARRATDYQRDPYSAYFSSEELRFPASPLPPGHEPPWKTPVMVVGADADARTFLFSQVAAGQDAHGTWRTTMGDRPVALHYHASPPAAWLESSAGEDALPIRYAFRFAWFAMTGGETPDHPASPPGT